tara:strand:+ start:490 stop:795 length:306 start_codon:yes stop_codon:yes gene_type:complete
MESLCVVVRENADGLVDSARLSRDASAARSPQSRGAAFRPGLQELEAETCGPIRGRQRRSLRWVVLDPSLNVLATNTPVATRLASVAADSRTRPHLPASHY